MAADLLTTKGWYPSFGKDFLTWDPPKKTGRQENHRLKMGRNQPQKEFGSFSNNPSAGDFQLGKLVVWGPVVWGPLGVPRSNNPFHNWILIVQTTTVPGKLRFHNLEMTHHVTVSDV